MNDFDAFLDAADAQADRDAKNARPSKTQQTYPCGQCAGTGRYQGARVHQAKTECFACRASRPSSNRRVELMYYFEINKDGRWLPRASTSHPVNHPDVRQVRLVRPEHKGWQLRDLAQFYGTEAETTVAQTTDLADHLHRVADGMSTPRHEPEDLRSPERRRLDEWSAEHPRDRLGLVAIAAWLNTTPDKLPSTCLYHTCEATRTAWNRVAEAIAADLDAQRQEQKKIAHGLMFRSLRSGEPK